MSRNIVSNAGAFYRAGFRFFGEESVLRRIPDLFTSLIPACFAAKTGLLPFGDPFFQVVCHRLFTLASTNSTLYCPTLKFSADWRSDRRLLH